MTSYTVRWKHREKGWLKSGENLTESQAKEMFDTDIKYFYSDITVEMVEVTEKIVLTRPGTHQRGKSYE